MNCRLAFVAAGFLSALSVQARAAAPQPFLEAVPLNPSDRPLEEAPRQFLLRLFQEEFLCERNYRQGSPTPTPAPETYEVSVTCDGRNQLVIRHEGESVVADTFVLERDCQAARAAFKRHAGCYCNSQNALRCIKDDFTMQTIGKPFTFERDCQASMKELDEQVRVKPRK